MVSFTDSSSSSKNSYWNTIDKIIPKLTSSKIFVSSREKQKGTPRYAKLIQAVNINEIIGRMHYEYVCTLFWYRIYFLPNFNT